MNITKTLLDNLFPNGISNETLDRIIYRLIDKAEKCGVIDVIYYNPIVVAVKPATTNKRQAHRALSNVYQFLNWYTNKRNCGYNDYYYTWYCGSVTVQVWYQYPHHLNILNHLLKPISDSFAMNGLDVFCYDIYQYRNKTRKSQLRIRQAILNLKRFLPYKAETGRITFFYADQWFCIDFME